MYTMYMALHITNSEVEREVRELAAARGQNITDLVGCAVRELRSSETPPKSKPSVDEVLALIRSFGGGPIDYSLTEDEILGYGPNGYCE